MIFLKKFLIFLLFLFSDLGVSVAATVESPDVPRHLREAAGRGDRAGLDKLLDGGVSLYASNTGYTAAYYAANNGKWDIVERLLARGYDPLALTQGRPGEAATFQRGLELLTEAAKQGRLDWVKRLIDLGIDVDAAKASGNQFEDPLCVALANNRHDVAMLLIASRAPLDSHLSVKPPPGSKESVWPSFSPLHLATLNRDLVVMRTILQAGGKIDAKNSEGQSALIMAAKNGWAEGVESLLAVGASRTVKDVAGKTIWDYVDNFPEIRLALLRNKYGLAKGDTPPPVVKLLMAINVEDVATTDQLLKEPGLADSRDANGIPVLFFAATWGRPNAIRKLIAAGANPNIRTDNGETVLYSAVFGGFSEIVRVLLENGADPNLFRPAGWSPLEQAIKRKDFATAELLLEKGAKPDMGLVPEGSAWRGPAICHAAQTGNLRMVTLLIEKGADVHAVDADGHNALLYACESNNPAVTELLVKHGLDINLVSPEGNTPLAIAVAVRSPKMVKMVLDLGGKPVALERALHELWPGNPESDEILAMLKAADAGTIAEGAFWAGRPTSQQIMSYIQGGGNPNYVGGIAPLWEALNAGDFELAQFLLEHGANPNLSGHVHGCPLWALVVGCNNNTEERAVVVATKMLELGAKPDGDTSDPYVRPPLGMAVMQGHAQLVEVLLRFGADPESGREAWQNEGSKLSPELQVKIRQLLDKTWAKPQKF